MAGVDDIRRSIRSSRISQNTSNHSSTSSSSSSTHSRTPDHIASLRRPDSIRATIENDHRMRATRRNAQPNDIAIPTKSRSQMVDEGEEEEGDGDVRCLCEQSDYPGHPLVLEEDKIHHGELVFITKEETTEDLAGFFLQCDTCKVWQHGGCVGIKSEAVSPEEYFCEECRAHLHKKFVAANEQVIIQSPTMLQYQLTLCNIVKSIHSIFHYKKAILRLHPEQVRYQRKAMPAHVDLLQFIVRSDVPQRIVAQKILKKNRCDLRSRPVKVKTVKALTEVQPARENEVGNLRLILDHWSTLQFTFLLSCFRSKLLIRLTVKIRIPSTSVTIYPHEVHLRLRSK